MAKNVYLNTLKKIMNNDAPARPTSRSKEEIEAAILAISAELKGPLSNTERLLLVEDRVELRKQLQAATAISR